MGQLFGQLTNSQLTDPSTGRPTASGSPSQMLAATKPLLDQQTPDPMNPNATPPPQLPFITQPSLQQAASQGSVNGAPNAMSPALTKAGKLAVILGSGLQGALAGRSASEQAVIQSGGHRSGGAGMGFEAAQQYPWQKAMQGQQLQQAQAQTGLTQAEGATVNVPGIGPMPAWLAKAVAPAAIGAGAKTESAQIGAGAKVASANIGQRYKAVPNVGLFDTSSMQVIPDTGQGIKITPEIAKDYNLPEEFIGKQMSVSNDATLQNVQNRGLATVSGASGPVVVNKEAAAQGKAGAVTPLGLGPASQGAPVQVADPNSPGNTKFVTGGQAIKSGAAGPSSASVEVPKDVLKSATSGPISNQIGAFNTAIQHADLLTQAVTALGNKDEQTLNSLRNGLSTEFGVTGPITAQTIADAYTREITKMLSAGHLTDSEVGTVGKTLNVNRQSMQQSLAALSAYKALATSKMNVLQQQVQQGMQGKANFPAQSGAQKFTDGGKTYNIPANLVNDFKKDHPNAR